MKRPHLARLTLFLAVLSLSLAVAQTNGDSVSLFDGKTLHGWVGTEGFWRVDGGAITAGSYDKDVPQNEFICTEKSYANFELALKIKCSGDLNTGQVNSGIQIRSARLPDGAVAGYQVDCGKGWFGKIYDEHRRRLIYPTPVDEVALLKGVDTFGWNEFRILAEGPRIQVWINGIKASDYTEENPDIPLNGIIAPQIHKGGHAMVQFKDVIIRELPPTPNAPTWESLGGPEVALQLVKSKQKPTAKRSKAAPAPTAPTDPSVPPLKPKKVVSEYNGQGEPRPATEQAKMFKLPAGYEIELVAQESDGIGKFISVYFDQRGRMWTQTALEYPVDGKDNPAEAEALYKGKGRDQILVYPREAVNGPLPEGGMTNPTVFADGLAMPLGMTPWGEGDVCFAMHGPDLIKLTDTDGDGKSDKREVILTGFGVLDSHLFPHQFTRAPGGWLWLAQGLYNMSEVRRPGDDQVIPFPKCSMARMRIDGSEFEVTSVGPNNIWGLVLTGEGESFIQEANDFGHSVVEFHDYAYYPGGMKPYRKSYQPEFPAVDFRLGGTGLSGLAALENGPGVAADADMTMLVANAITSRINAVRMTRDGSYWEYEALPDFITCEDPMFRPVAMSQGPDGCVYIVDWYNRIISHNEVPRNHPDRDKTRGRIWRVKPTDGEGIFEIPDFTKASDEELTADLGKLPTARAHIAWQTLADRKASLQSVLSDKSANDAKRIQAFWALPPVDRAAAASLAKSQNRNLRRELARHPEFADLFLDDPDREVRFATIQTLAKQLPEKAENVLPKLLSFAKPSIENPETKRSSRSPEMIPIREGYDREFERYLVRMFLEKHPETVSQFLDSDAARQISAEARMLATLALDPQLASQKIGAVLGSLNRAPNAEEIQLIAKYPNAPGIAEAMRSLLGSPETATAVVRTLLERQATLDPATVRPFLTPAAKAMLAGHQAAQAAELIGAFKLASLEPDLVAVLKNAATPEPVVLAGLTAIGKLQSSEVDVLVTLAANPATPEIGHQALLALAASKSPVAVAKVIEALPNMSIRQQRDAVARLSTKKESAGALVAALLDGRVSREALEVSAAERLASVLKGTPELAEFMNGMDDTFRDILQFDGSPTAWADTKIELDGAFTIEAWVRLAPGISNADSLLGNPGVFDLNFSQSKVNVWAGKSLKNVAVSSKPVAPDLWTHVAVTRNAKGQVAVYMNGELDVRGTKPTKAKFTDLSVGRSSPQRSGTNGAIAEFRIWNVERTAQEIRQNFDRSFANGSRPESLVFYNAGGGENWGQLGKGASIAKTTDLPPLLTEEESKVLAAKFEKYTALGQKGGDPVKGQALSALCTSCHVIKGSGGQIGPDLSGAGAMGLEAVLRNVLTPNAAMESGYRIFRVERKNGEVLDAFYVSEDESSIIVRQPGGPDQRIARKEIRSTQYIRRSLMPEGLLDGLTDEMAADLLAYLMTLK